MCHGAHVKVIGFTEVTSLCHMGPEIELKSSGLVALSYEAILLAFSIL